MQDAVSLRNRALLLFNLDELPALPIGHVVSSASLQVHLAQVRLS
jgi:hypothetical protein